MSPIIANTEPTKLVPINQSSGFDSVTTNELFELLKIRVEKAQKMFNELNHQNEFNFLAESFSANVNEIMAEINIRLVE